MLLPAFLLVGCAKEISAEDAAKRVEEINEKRKAEPLTEIKMSYTEKRTEGESETAYASVYEKNEGIDFYHVKNEGGYAFEAWGYKEEGKYYAALSSSEGKFYSEFTEAQKDLFLEAIGDYRSGAEEVISGFVTINLDNLKKSFAEGCTADFKYSSEGSGHLKVELEGSATLEEVAHEYELSGEWKDYKPLEFKCVDKTSAKKDELSASFSYSVSVSHPDLAAEGYIKA